MKHRGRSRRAFLKETALTAGVLLLPTERLLVESTASVESPQDFSPADFQLTRLAGQPTAGMIKDVVMLGGYQEAEIDFAADNPGLTPFHCHQQLHMDFGFMSFFDYV